MSAEKGQKKTIRIPNQLCGLIEEYRKDNPAITNDTVAILILIQKGLEAEGYIVRGENGGKDSEV